MLICIYSFCRRVGKLEQIHRSFYTIKIVHIILFLPRLQRNAGEDFFITKSQIIKKLGE